MLTILLGWQRMFHIVRDFIRDHECTDRSGVITRSQIFITYGFLAGARRRMYLLQ